MKAQFSIACDVDAADNHSEASAEGMAFFMHLEEESNENNSGCGFIAADPWCKAWKQSGSRRHAPPFRPDSRADHLLVALRI